MIYLPLEGGLFFWTNLAKKKTHSCWEITFCLVG